MIKLGTVFWLTVVCAMGFVMFKVKYDVQDLEDALLKVRKQTVSTQNEIRVLTAEWTFLNQPERLEELNGRFLALAPITPQQLSRNIADLPLRAPEPPAEGAGEMVADSVQTAPAEVTARVVTASLDRAAAGFSNPGYSSSGSAAPAYSATDAPHDPQRAAARAVRTAAARPPQSLDDLFEQVAGSQ